MGLKHSCILCFVRMCVCVSVQDGVAGGVILLTSLTEMMPGLVGEVIGVVVVVVGGPMVVAFWSFRV